MKYAKNGCRQKYYVLNAIVCIYHESARWHFEKITKRLTAYPILG